MSNICLLSYQAKVQYLMEKIKDVASTEDLTELQEALDNLSIELNNLDLYVKGIVNMTNSLVYNFTLTINQNQFDSDNSYTIDLNTIPVPFSNYVVEVSPYVGGEFVLNKAIMESISAAKLVLVEDDAKHITVVAEKPATISLLLTFYKRTVQAAINSNPEVISYDN